MTRDLLAALETIYRTSAAPWQISKTTLKLQLQDTEMHLNEFYGNVILKKHKWSARKARDEEYQLIANRLLKLVDGSTGVKREESSKVVIGVGLGKFSTMSRLPPLHESFQPFLFKSCRCERIPRVPRLRGVCWSDIRRLYCSNCKTYMHRDIMAGHNICNAIPGHLLNQQRPLYLQPKDI
ncbi:hypothetical protein EDD21DRAFT_408500, partial [Dissophora ornata]